MTKLQHSWLCAVRTRRLLDGVSKMQQRSETSRHHTCAARKTRCWVLQAGTFNGAQVVDKTTGPPAHCPCRLASSCESVELPGDSRRSARCTWRKAAQQRREHSTAADLLRLGGCLCQMRVAHTRDHFAELTLHSHAWKRKAAYSWATLCASNQPTTVAIATLAMHQALERVTVSTCFTATPKRT